MEESFKISERFGCDEPAQTIPAAIAKQPFYRAQADVCETGTRAAGRVASQTSRRDSSAPLSLDRLDCQTWILLPAAS